jgi:vancomycin resistance protein YoaR
VGVVLVILSLLLVLAGSLLFARALMLRDSVLPGVSVAGIDVGGLSRADAQARLAAELGARLEKPVTVQVGNKSLVVAPDDLWRLDVAATEERAFRAGRDSVVSRLGALVVPSAFPQDGEPALELQPAGRRATAKGLRRITRRPVDAKLRMDGNEVVLVSARFGTAVDVRALLPRLEAAALSGASSVVAELAGVRPNLTTAEAQAAQAQAETIVSAPVAIRFRGKKVGELGPRALAGLVRFTAVQGAFRVGLDRDALAAQLAPMLEARTREPVDARFEVVGNRVRVIRSRPGTTLAPEKAQAAVLGAALRPENRTAAVVVTKLPADLTTRDAKALGIRERVSTFTTDMGESSANRIWNVHLLGDYLDGTIVKAGGTFSYNEAIGPRTAERGFREGQMIFGGVLIPSIGGGVCQTATTIFNAAFEAGLPIKARTNHSFYISHYPMGRDATVSWGGPEFVFENDLDHAVLIDVTYTDATFTVSLYGTKQRRKVVSTTSEPTNYTQPRLQYAVDPSAPPNSVRTAAGGGPGFDVNVHRKVFEKGKVIREDDFFTRYVPQNPTAIYGPGRTPPGPFFYLPSSG